MVNTDNDGEYNTDPPVLLKCVNENRVYIAGNLQDTTQSPPLYSNKQQVLVGSYKGVPMHGLQWEGASYSYYQTADLDRSY